ncbi:SGNH/GDSL hydrolase family protein [Flavobacterium gawalongense]|uniref:G-D-S-L family lipolytic protein n=1 Tax=Flavobacterium gawalongense TaxID=2594432 RepID=A0A553BW57_9FLAO|nr:G-D-S-L family lipolytic protein [Flavobacterium gawalongense]TRX02084.1 G-D-S-L family lipolytic protein [Flavobacterium gawalongense]TRX06612.1 G-D-S-L family lipolytic protein [Flavobacterium gawalongense]TRX12459.1 G-D-S-L family lipolytic protein [Flavobacterium gawalongense]TRX12720.1 G-D-S-L family lipolytic protein [Flavobacterium gawalongense]TRX30491.1 G-D-S-L family lipolytic protein [Flavobacterium gawalongense]
MIKNFKWLLLVSLSFVACNNDDENSTPVEVPVTSGTASFSKYVALGDSFAAGYSDGALFKKGQEGSYVNILAQQFTTAGGGDFKTPFTSDNLGGLLLGGNVIAGTRLYFKVSTSSPASVAGIPTTEVTNHVTGPFNNLGVPGAKSYHLVAPGYGNVAGVATGAANPYFARFATASGTTVLADALVQVPTFFSLWIGVNDVLSYATSGGVGVNQTGNLNPATYGGNDITDPNVFASVYSSLVTNLTANGAKGVVANLPYVNTLPYFTTVPYNPLTAKVLGSGSEAVGQATIAALNAQLYGPLKQALTAFGAGDRINLLSTTVANPMLIKDESLVNLSAQLTAAFTPSLGAATAAFYGSVFGQARQATAADLVVLPTQSAIGAAPTASDSGIGMAPPSPLNKFGITYPLQDKHVLVPTEVAEVKVATDAYNSSIKTIADAKGLAFVDTKVIMTQLSSGGIVSNSFTLTSAYVTGGAFSLDGVHPSPRGYALIANAFTAAINAKYSSTLKPVDLSLYPILYPATIQ